nr:hypothetical protein [Tanacetum cinerariifolium]
PPPAQYLEYKSLAASRRHVATSYWTAASDVAPTSARSVTVNAAGHWSTAADHGDHRSMVVGRQSTAESGSGLGQTSSAIPTGREIERSASSRVIHVGDKSRRESLFHTDNGVRLMLAPGSAKAKHSAFPGKSHGIKNLPGSPRIEGLWLGLGALTEEATGLMVGELTGSEVKIEDSDWTTRGRKEGGGRI